MRRSSSCDALGLPELPPVGEGSRGTTSIPDLLALRIGA